MFSLIYNYFYPPQEELEDFYYLSLLKEQDGSFSIHGLWPQTTPDKYPTFCKKVRFDMDCLFPIMGPVKNLVFNKERMKIWKHSFFLI